MKDDRLGIWDLVVPFPGQCLVFCPTKAQCEQLAGAFLRHIKHTEKQIVPDLKHLYLEMNKIGQRLQESSSKQKSGRNLINQDFCTLLSVGLAYHHSGLSLEEREICECLYKQGLLKVLFCTSTLAAGVNLPAGRVIITSTKQAGNRCENLSSIQYKQMVGRAGRTGQSTHGDSILITNDRGLALKIATKELEPVQSCLADEKKGQSRLVLEAIGIGLATTEPELLEYMKSTLLWQQ